MNNVPLIALPEEIKEPEAFALQEILCQLSKNQPLQIVLDFSKTNLVDFRCSEVLLNSVKNIKNRKIEIVCWSMNQSVMHTLTSIRFTEVASIDLDTNISISLVHNYEGIKPLVLYRKIILFLTTQIQSLVSKAYKT